MADSNKEDELPTAPRDSLVTDASTTSEVEDLRRELDEAQNLCRVKEDEIVRLMHSCNSHIAQSNSDWQEIKAAKKEIERLRIATRSSKLTILEHEAKIKEVEASLSAANHRIESLESSQKAMEVERNKGRLERLLKSKDYELERLKKEIAKKDETIRELENKNSSHTQEAYVVEESHEDNTPVVCSNVAEIIELSSEDEEKNERDAGDFVEEVIQASNPKTTDDEAETDISEDDDSGDNPNDLSDDPNYLPNPNWYRNKIVKKLKRKRKVKGEEARIEEFNVKRTRTKGNGVFECPVCPQREDGTRQIYTGVTGLNYHMSINHPDHPGFRTERFKCSDCPEVFVRKADLTKHLRSIHLEVRYKCKYCTKSFSSPHYCYNHEKLHEKTGGGPAVLTCSLCSKVFSSELGLRQHLVTIHPKGVGNYKCKHCNATFQHLAALRLHITSNHRAKNLQCPHCPKTYTKRGGLRRHIQTHSMDSTDNKMDVSGVGGGLRHSREAKRQLLQHLESQGLSEDQANQSLNSSVIEDLFPGNFLVDGSKEEKETACQYCGMEFGSHRQLKIHVSRHSFKCVNCVDVFDQASSLRYHLSVVHKIEGEKAEELVKEGVQPMESQTAATKKEPILEAEVADLI